MLYSEMLEREIEACVAKGREHCEKAEELFLKARKLRDQLACALRLGKYRDKSTSEQ